MALRRPSVRPPARPSARLVALAALAGTLPALVGATTAVADVSQNDQAAAVIEITRQDRTGDVRAVGGRTASQPQRRLAATDLRSVGVRLDRGAGVLRVTWTLRDLRRVHGDQLAAVHARTDGGTQGEGPLAMLDLASGRVVRFDETSHRRCPAAEVRVRWQRDLVVADLPFTCLGAAEAARVQPFVVTLPRRNGAILLDRARRTRALPFTRVAGDPTPTEEATGDQATGDQAVVDAARRAARVLR